MITSCHSKQILTCTVFNYSIVLEIFENDKYTRSLRKKIYKAGIKYSSGM